MRGCGVLAGMRSYAVVAVVLSAVAALAGCDAGQPDAPRSASVIGGPSSPAQPRPATPSRVAVPSAAADGCAVTPPVAFEPPPGVAANELFGADASYGNGQLWVGGLGQGGVIAQPPEADGSIRYKLGWWRATEGQLQITGHRLDAPAPALRAEIPDGYGPTGFQASGLYFPTDGCWQVEGRVGAAVLTFVTWVTGER